MPPMPPMIALKSELLTRLGVRHGFSTRLGGVSEGPFATLNVAVGPGDRPEAVQENLRRFADAVAVDPARLFQSSQVHGASVREIARGDVCERVLKEEADALIARDVGISVGVRVADCVPVLLFHEDSGHVAAVHAGWRGVVGQVVPAAMAALARHSGARTIAAAIGPCIGVCCFEVGEEVVAAMEQTVPDDRVVSRTRQKPHVDLRRAVRAQLLSVGVADERIEDVPGCTRCDGERFFSFRRDGARSGRHLGAIAAP